MSETHSYNMFTLKKICVVIRHVVKGVNNQIRVPKWDMIDEGSFSLCEWEHM